MIQPGWGQVFVDDTLRLFAEARTSTGTPLSGRTFVWTSDRDDIVSVDATGLLTGRTAGSTSVSASTGGRTASVAIEVMDVVTTPPPPPPPPAPVIDSIWPRTIQAGWGDFTLQVFGAGFVEESRVLWQGVRLPTSFISLTELGATVSASYVAIEGDAEVTVETPAPFGYVSNAVTLQVSGRPALAVELRVPGNTVLVGDAVPLAAVARDQLGEIIEGKTIQWTSSDTTVAKVEGEVLRGRKPGSISLTAHAVPTSASTTFFVAAPPVESIIFAAAPTGAPELFYRTLDPASPVQRMLAPGYFAKQAAPSPDGAYIAFVRRDAAGNEDVYLMDRRTGDVSRLTTADAIDGQPTWSPDGSSIAFRSNRDYKSDIWVMDVDGGNQRNLTYASVFLAGEYNDGPSWSPDGQTILFSRGFGLGQALYKIGADGQGLTEFLAMGGADLLEPAWSPDGLRIAYWRRDRASGTDAVELVSADAGLPLLLVSQPPMGARSPSWLTDGWLALSAPVLPLASTRSVALWRVGFANVVAPVGEGHGQIEYPRLLPD